jgi:hypothetical protein
LKGTLEGILVERAASSPNLLPEVLRGTAAAARATAPAVGGGVAALVSAAVTAGVRARGILDARALQLARASVAAAGAAAVPGGESGRRPVAAARTRTGEPRAPAGDPLQRRAPGGTAGAQRAAATQRRQQQRQQQQGGAPETNGVVPHKGSGLNGRAPRDTGGAAEAA